MSEVKEETKNKKTETSFDKAAFLKSGNYNKDVINTLLKDDMKYTKAEVEKIYNDFMKGKVK